MFKIISTRSRKINNLHLKKTKLIVNYYFNSMLEPKKYIMEKCINDSDIIKLIDIFDIYS